MQPIWALGLMSGTSADGIDAAIILTDGCHILDQGPGLSVAYDAAFQSRLKACFGQETLSAEIQDVERILTYYHSDVVRRLQTDFPHPLAVIGFHGQTIFHAPPKTWQIGDGELLAQLTGIDVVYDMRQNDVQHRGQGAPLVPVFHRGLVADIGQPVVVANIGGVANLTYVDCDSTDKSMSHEGELIAFDTGPGGALLDDWIQRHFNQSYDTDGKICTQGTIFWPLVNQWLAHDYFAKSYPKSLDRNQFQCVVADLGALSGADGAATLAAFTAASLASGVKMLPKIPACLYLTGGGRHHVFMVALLERLLPQTKIAMVDALGVNGDWLEAQAWAYLAVRSLYGLPFSFPLTTGVEKPLSGGTHVKNKMGKMEKYQ